MVGSRPDGWWRDRPAAFAQFVVRLDHHARATGEEVTVVFDGPAWAFTETPVRVAHSPYADDRIIELATAHDLPSPLIAVTSDRKLAERIRLTGATVMNAGSFLRLLDRSDFTA